MIFMLDAVVHKAERIFFFSVILLPMENGRVSMKSAATQEFIKRT